MNEPEHYDRDGDGENAARMELRRESSSYGMRVRSPRSSFGSTRAVVGEVEQDPLVPVGVSDRKDAIGVQGSGVMVRGGKGGRSEQGAVNVTGENGQELSFWSFSKQLASHGNFWL